MNIAILGTRGIPNQYGGFEQFAEKLSVGLVQKGHNVTVYNPKFHDFQGTDYKGVNVVYKHSPESFLGASANFIYDYFCLRDALKRDFDIILECGYGTASASYYITPVHRTILVTNMDGMEWHRTKWNGPVQKLMKLFEKWGVKKSHALVADNDGIKKYLADEYRVDAEMIPYGADIFDAPDENYIKKYSLSAKEYYLLIARMEPENNIEMILDGYDQAETAYPFLVVGNVDTTYGNYLRNRYSGNKNIRLLGGIYETQIINNLRYYSLAYFHGHSVGGTNPSLLEAMACGCSIISHDNPFNRSVLEDDAIYFKRIEDVTTHIRKLEEQGNLKEGFVKNNIEKIKTTYSWNTIVEQYEKYFLKLVTEING